jgi:HSP20 family protein
MALSGLVDGVFQTTLNRFFDNPFLGFGNMVDQVPVNIRETEKSYEMEVMAAGLKKEDFNVQQTPDALIVSYEHKEETKEESKDEGYVRNEYTARSFSRSFSLDDTIYANGIVASYTDGILHLTLPKKEGTKKITKTIKVK